MAEIILGIDPGLANTGWGIIEKRDHALYCIAYGCISTSSEDEFSSRLLKIHNQIRAVIQKYRPNFLGIESVLFGQNVTAAFKTGQARGAALVACAESGLQVGEYTPCEIKMAVVGSGSADKKQVQYMVQQTLKLESIPKPDHAADALAAAICYTTHSPYARLTQIKCGISTRRTSGSYAKEVS